MKRLFLFSLLLTTALLCGAQDTVYIGNVGIGSTNLHKIPYDGYKGVCSRIGGTVVKKYAGKEAVGVRVCFGSYVITDIHAFLSADPDPEQPQTDLASTTLEHTFMDWCDVFFDTPYTLMGTEGDVYMGYYFTCPDTEEYPAANEYPVVFGSGKITHGLLIYDYYEQYQVWGWGDYSDMGILAIQLILRDKVADKVEYVQVDTPHAPSQPLFDLTGRKVANSKAVNGKLPRGLYIQNGRKYVRR